MRQETRKALNLTADYAARALHFLIADGKLAIRDVTTALSRRRKLIKSLKDRFTALETEMVSGAAKARKVASPKTAKSRSRKATRAKAGARSVAKAAGKVTRKQTIARSTAGKTTTRKAAVKVAVSPKPTRKRIPATRLGAVAVKTKTPALLAEGAVPAREKKPRSSAGIGNQPPAPAPTTEKHGLPKVANPEQDGRGPARGDWSQT